MSFFDDIENDIFPNDISDNLLELYKITTIDKVNDAKSMAEYIFNISGIDDIIRKIKGNHTMANVLNILNNYNFDILNTSDNFKYKIIERHPIRYIVIPKYEHKEVRLCVNFQSGGIIQITYFNATNMYWSNILTYYSNDSFKDTDHNINELYTQLLQMVTLKPAKAFNVYKNKYINGIVLD